ncbi:MAG: hypothetical protein R2764_01890 [Bacteroidales bacterium]
MYLLWNYSRTRKCFIYSNSDIVDWVLVEYRDAIEGFLCYIWCNDSKNGSLFYYLMAVLLVWMVL